jgi:triacylglycerol lipase
VAFRGWLAGGHAALSAAELPGTYAPDVHVVEPYANAAPTDLAATVPSIDDAFRHLQPWFNSDLDQLVHNDPFSSILGMQRIGNTKPTGPVYISQNRWDPFGPYQSTLDTARDWCAKGADVQLWTNEEPPFLNKADVNALLPAFVDGERSMAWISDRFNGAPTTPNCEQL